MKSDKLSEVIRKIEIWFLVVCGVSSTLIMCFNAAGRYIFHHAFVWAEEVVRLFFVTSMFIAITDSFFSNEHIGFSNLMSKNRVTKYISAMMCNLILIVVGLVLGIFGARYNRMTGDVPLPATGLPTALFQIPGFLAGFIWIGLGVFRVVIETIKFIKKEKC